MPNFALAKAYLEKNGQPPAPNHSWYRDLKKTVSCIDCGESFPDCPEVIVFHHENGRKTESISAMIMQGRPNREIWKEIRKCIPLCSNCHIKRHVNQKLKERSRG